jgi:hypothetical protein
MVPFQKLICAAWDSTGFGKLAFSVEFTKISGRKQCVCGTHRGENLLDGDDSRTKKTRPASVREV